MTEGMRTVDAVEIAARSGFNRQQKGRIQSGPIAPWRTDLPAKRVDIGELFNRQRHQVPSRHFEKLILSYGGHARRNPLAPRLMDMDQEWVGIGWILAVIFLLLAGGNASIVLRGLIQGKSGSPVPLIGGVAGLCAFRLLPYPLLNRWWWTPLVLDLGTVCIAIVAVVFLVRRFGGDKAR